MSLEQYCKDNNLDKNKVFNMVMGEGGGILPCPAAFTGYMAEITDNSVICRNNKLNVYREIPFASFESAEFGIGSGNLWLQCVVEGSPFVFCSPRKSWKSPAAKLLIQKIEEQTGIIDKKEYEHFTGKLFLLYMLIR
ncbi:MAG: hypothetical protein E7616_07030 [Ruminococcaceae bacterium]|nr:hypothetical protein [Oscillospiraceae bacterium]